MDWVEVGPGGRIETFTIVDEPFNGLPDPPYAFGDVLLDNADTAIGGFFKGLDLSNPGSAAKALKGSCVTTRFAENRVGAVLDFWFEPNQGNPSRSRVSSTSALIYSARHYRRN